MCAFMPKVVTGLAVTVVAAGSAAALEGDLTPETRERLATRITVREERVSLRELLGGMTEETGLSVVCPLDLAGGPEPVTLVANEATAEDLIDAVAFCLHLEVMATPGGVIAFRLREKDPRREATFRRYSPPLLRLGEGGPPPKLLPGEVIEHVSRHPKVRDFLDETGARLFPGKFIHEKRVWILHVRREDEKRPLATVFASEDGEVVGFKKGGDEEKGKEKKEKERRKEQKGKERWKEQKDGERWKEKKRDDRPRDPRRKEAF